MRHRKATLAGALAALCAYEISRQCGVSLPDDADDIILKYLQAEGGRR